MGRMSYQAVQLVKDFESGEKLASLIVTQSCGVFVECLVEFPKIRGGETKGADYAS